MINKINHINVRTSAILMVNIYLNLINANALEDFNYVSWYAEKKFR